jgi:TolB-like protein
VAIGAVFFLATPVVAGQFGGVFTSSLTEAEIKHTPLRNKGFDSAKSIASIAILPLENLSDNPLASKMVRDNIKAEFEGRGLFRIASTKDVNRFLARRRIRYTGAITRVAVREMGKVLGVDAALLGTINYYSIVGNTLIVGLNCRMLSAVDGRIIWAENVTYSGKDFEGVLGLGSVKSLEALAAMVVKDLVEDLKERFFVRDSAHGPFEIERVITYPVMGKSGGKRDINVRFLNLDGTPRIVKALVGNQEYILSKGIGGEYRGVIDAPMGEGTHLVDIVAITSRREPYVFSAASKVVVDDTAPVIAMTSSREVFSSKKSGFVVFEPKLLSLDEIDEWSVNITNVEGEVVRSDRGYGRVPTRLKWKGEDTEQAYVKDGNYIFSLTVKDPSGNAANVENVIMVKNAPPEIDVDVEIVEETVLFSFNYAPDEPIDSWKIAIVDRGGNVVKMVSGQGRTLPERFEYPIGSDYDIKKLSFTVEAKDVAGNEFKMTKTIPSLFASKVPFAGLKGLQKVLWNDF